LETGLINTQTNLQRWERHAEWPLAAAALIFLGVFLIAVLLMIGGISLVGVVTAALASWIIQRVADEETASQVATAAHIDELRSEIRELAQQLRGRQ
jgi:hypothetical protein